MYQNKSGYKSAINTKITKKLYPEIFNDRFPELNNLRVATQVDLHRVGEFNEAKKSPKFKEPKTADGYSVTPNISFNTAARLIPYMPDDDRRENFDQIVQKYKQKLDDLRDQKDVWKQIRNELTEERQTKLMLKVIKNNLVSFGSKLQGVELLKSIGVLEGSTKA